MRARDAIASKKVADMELGKVADKADSRVILPTIDYIDGKSEIMTPLTDSLTHSLSDSPNYKEMLSHLKSEVKI